MERSHPGRRPRHPGLRQRQLEGPAARGHLHEESWGGHGHPLLGFDSGALKDRVDLHVLAASDQHGVIEDVHMAVGHIVTFWLKQRCRP